MIYVTGDLHGSSQQLFEREERMELRTKNDILIVAGDFGFIWKNDFAEKLILDVLSYKPYTLCFIDGNHENFPAIYKYPEEEWNGGKVHKIRDNVLHLQRGQVFEIEGKKIYTFGGALSTDRFFHKKDVSYWDEEIPSPEEIEEGRRNLAKHNNCVDYIITHTLPSSVKTLMNFPPQETDEDKPFTDFLDEVRVNVTYKKWYAGHFHMNAYANYSDNIKILYEGCDELI